MGTGVELQTVYHIVDGPAAMIGAEAARVVKQFPDEWSDRP